jgi:DNA-binding Lrp family transcriptional regulator
MRKILLTTASAAAIYVGGAVLPVNLAAAQGQPCPSGNPNCVPVPSVPPNPYVPPQDERRRERRASPPVFTARVHECVVREVTLTARTRELLAERVAQAPQRAECLPAGTLERNAALTLTVSELEAINVDLREEILRLQGLLDETEAENLSLGE